MNTIIVGAGASGLTAAIFAGRKGDSVTVIEHTNKPAKKILITGNGRCNITNKNMNSTFFYGDKEFIDSVLNRFSFEDTIRFFKSVGVHTLDKNGYIYPSSMQAESVLTALRNTAENIGVKIKTNNEVNSIKKENDSFIVDVGIRLKCDKLIIATGGMSAPKTGSDGSGYKLAKMFGHSIIQPMPALTALIILEDALTKASGVRIKGRVLVDGTYSSIGEIQITDYGISGIPVFNVSRFTEENSRIIIDFCPDFTLEDITKIISDIFIVRKNENAQTALTGIVNEKLAGVLLEKCNIKNIKCHCFSETDIYKIGSLIKKYPVIVSGRREFEFSQVTQGGVDTSEINRYTMESKIVKNLYFAGEIINIDAICGGYNLQWAWSTGAIAGGRF